MKINLSNTLTSLLLLTIFTGCTLPPQTLKGSSNQTSAQPTESEESIQIKSSQKVTLLLEQQEYAEAIEFSAKGLKVSPAEQLAEGFIKAVNGGLKQADLLMESENFKQAALLLKTIKDNYPVEPLFQQQLNKTSAQVEKAFHLSTQKMMDAGLIAYRASDFSAAIDIWKDILAIDPHHAAAQNSLQTTEIQLTKLKDLNSKN